ncbi:serine/threonine protein kinase, partial [bacterium]
MRVLEDHTTDEGEPFLVMEILRGETVLDAWRKVGRQMAIIPALQIAERVIDCLAFCHEVGVIHRDLKPANLFITDASEIKVLDFGVAQMRDDDLASASSKAPEARSAVGTPAYMSPEQAMGRDVDGRTDLFSVGAILHALITGHRIHAAKTEAESLVLAASRPVPSVKTIAPNLPPEVARLIDRSLAWDRQSRFASAAAMQSAALEALASQGGEPLGEKGGKARGLVFDLSGAPTRAP